MQQHRSDFTTLIKRPQKGAMLPFTCDTATEAQCPPQRT